MRNRDLRISLSSREKMDFFEPVFETDEDLSQMYRQAQDLAFRYNRDNTEKISAARLSTTAVLHLIYQTVISNYLKTTDNNPFTRITALASKNESAADVLYYYNKKFPTELDHQHTNVREGVAEETARAFFVHQVLQDNPAYLSTMKNMLNQKDLSFPDGTKALRAMMSSYLQFPEGQKKAEEEDLFSFLTKPSRLYPDDLEDQVTYIMDNWEEELPGHLRQLLVLSLDYIHEEDHPHGFGGPGEVQLPYFDTSEYESFTKDRNWMPNVVMMAKSTLVWLDQLSKKYGYEIRRLDQIPDSELDYLHDCGFTALWLIGLWERSPASKKIKNLCGNPDAESSAYSLKGYEISSRLGGWSALTNLRERCWARGIRLASDMVPNHTGLDSDWLYSHGSYFVQQDYPPFPNYTYTGADLSCDPEWEIRIEDHYYNRTDAAVTFRKRNRRTGETKYIFHGNDGTTMPWNDTAQLDFLNPETREAVIQQILEVARNFPIIRFDAAMTLAKRHIQRLWYPKPGQGGDIAGRVEHSMSDEQFNMMIPQEFWREVVDRIQSELPDTLLLAEAFWMMEGYFVRTLGMHRVYNSAFMHMMKNQDNAKYRASIKSTLTFDPEILKRYVNFMNNPDEDTAINQFGDSDKYFGVCTTLSTMPGLPMFGHGQLEGFREKYGMEYQRAYLDEKPDQRLLEEHRRRIFPLLKMRRLFSECENFWLFDVIDGGQVNEDVYAYVNGDDSKMALVLYNNRYERSCGRILQSAEKVIKDSDDRHTETRSIAQSLRLTMSPRRFVVCRCFEDGLYYVYPSMKLFDDGFEVNLNGYQTRILLDIHEVEDIDGNWDRLCKHLDGKGVSDIDLEFRLLELEPLFEVAEGMRSQKLLKELKALLTNRGSANARVEVLQQLATCYTYMEELGPLLEKMGLSMKQMKPGDEINYIKDLEEKCKTAPVCDANSIMSDDLVRIFSAAFMIKPFVRRNCTYNDVFRIMDRLLLDHFFEMDKTVLSRCALILSDQCDSVESFIDSSAFRYLAGCNQWQGVTWFKGEYCLECITTFIITKALREKSVDEKELRDTLSKWITKVRNAGYRLDALR